MTAYRAHEIAYSVAGLAVCAALWALHCYLDWRFSRDASRRNRQREEERQAALREHARQ